MDNLESKIIADIQKSGFGSEMRTLRAARDAGWAATGSVHYVDRDTGLSRESDIEAHHVVSEASADEKEIYLQSFLSLSIEVKKSERPWIVFRETPTYPFQLYDGNSALYFCAGLKKAFRKGITHTIGDTGLANRMGWYGNGMHEAFKSPDQPSRWYSAFTSVCKAAEYELENESWYVDPDKDDDDHFPYLWLSKPVVVLDGALYSAELDNNDELSLKSEKYCTVRFSYLSAEYRRDKYFVDVVTLSSFADYLSRAEERNSQLATALQRLRDHGNKKAGGQQ